MPTTVRVHKPMDFNVIDFHFVTIYGAKSAASAPEVHLMRELAPASRVFCGLWGLVPGGGVEPPRPEGRRILSPLRLPVPPSRLWGGFLIVRQCVPILNTLTRAAACGRALPSGAIPL